MEAALAAFIKDWGAWGVIVALLLEWIRRGEARSTKLENENTDLRQQVSVLYEKRVSESKESDDVIRGNMTALHTLGQVVENLTAAVRGKRRP